jgi:hypothetical protein
MRSQGHRLLEIEGTTNSLLVDRESLQDGVRWKSQNALGLCFVLQWGEYQNETAYRDASAYCSERQFRDDCLGART